MNNEDQNAANGFVRSRDDEFLYGQDSRDLAFDCFLAGANYARSQMQLYQVNLDEVKGLPDTSNLEPIVGFPKTIVTINGEEFQVLSEPEYLAKLANG